MNRFSIVEWDPAWPRPTRAPRGRAFALWDQERSTAATDQPAPPPEVQIAWSADGRGVWSPDGPPLGAGWEWLLAHHDEVVDLGVPADAWFLRRCPHCQAAPWRPCLARFNPIAGVHAARHSLDAKEWSTDPSLLRAAREHVRVNLAGAC